MDKLQRLVHSTYTFSLMWKWGINMKVKTCKYCGCTSDSNIKFVSGLHTSSNLQVIPATVNFIKNNSYHI